MDYDISELAMYKTGTKVAYKYTSNCLHGDVGAVIGSKMISEDDDCEYNGIVLTIETSDGRKCYRMAEEVIILPENYDRVSICKRELCDFCGYGDACKDDTLYKYNSWDGGIDFERIRIQYCPVCGKELPDE